ncbi:L,D-transpeptidase family protein [Pelagibius litoralis]|uniref:L,D-transpeptidase family protein n=1 Tax=Pelagibius litoralis TaxID=374515 RepID=A0A967F1Y7_9PROT|nr:L,D-transpeptidase family protein [Pelagibius litoralis]NIA71681.1 L,D-transpeptidase family protein [Pelagibius litoralis]
MELTVSQENGVYRASWGDRRWRCAVGRSGITTAKREGDGATPVGVWPLRRLLYRDDRLEHPKTALSCRTIGDGDGWCDAPEDPAYNQPVQLPYPASHEVLRRDDHLYDLLVVLGYNDAPVVPGLGSAIFLHLAQSDYSGTEGCVALAQADLLTLLSEAGPGDAVRVLGEG